ncbi:MAG: 30S ribosomal protein S8 [Candidatus Woesearchaeota archaeon]|nr:30S ribosomal protein S8 [Candidatus Woesearchaeota archaeon]
MALNDPISDVLSSIMNAEKIGRKECVVKGSKIVKDVLNIMNRHNYIGSFKEDETRRGLYLTVNLLGSINKCGVIKPRHSVSKDNFEKFEKRYLPAKNFGVLIVSTNKGLKSDEDAKKEKLGGRLIAYCY